MSLHQLPTAPGFGDVLKPATRCYLDELHRKLRRDRARYASRFWHGTTYDPATQGPAWDVFVRPAHTTYRP